MSEAAGASIPKYIFLVCEAVVGVLSVTSNSLVVLDMFKKKDFLTTTNIFNGHLATADILVGLWVSPLSILLTLYGHLLQRWSCVGVYSIILMTTNASIIMLLCVAGERFIAIRFPFQYHSLVDSTNASYFLLGVWIFCLALGFLPYFWSSAIAAGDRFRLCSFEAAIPYDYLFYVNFLSISGGAILAISSIYVYITMVINKIKRQDSRRLTRFDSKVSIARKRTFNHPFYLILFILVAVLPIHIYHTLMYFEVITHWSKPVKDSLFYMATILNRINSVINPFIYYNPNIRKKSKKPLTVGVGVYSSTLFQKTTSKTTGTTGTTDDQGTAKQDHVTFALPETEKLPAPSNTSNSLKKTKPPEQFLRPIRPHKRKKKKNYSNDGEVSNAESSNYVFSENSKSSNLTNLTQTTRLTGKGE